MGIIASTMRLLTLTAYKNQLEMRVQGVTENLVGLQAQIDELVTIGADLDPLNLIEKKLEMMQKQFQAKLEAVNQEIQSCQQMLSGNIQGGAFKYTLAG